MLGEDSKVALYPGHIYQSFVIGTNYCKYNTSNGCYASKAGTYNRAQAFQDGTGSTSQIQYRPPAYDWMAGIDIQGALPEFWVDRMVFESPGGDQNTVHNASLTLIESQMLAYPSGKWYPDFAGCLGVGAPDTVDMSFSTPTDPVNASLVPGMLWFNNRIPSNSFSMHIGSVASRLEGSLWFGGYDRNRLVGDVLVANEDFNRNPITLKDISIDVIQGFSPFEFTDQDGLLASGNDSISNGLRVTIDGCAPYLTLPRSTCDSIASHLPVTYDDGLGLYLWNIDSPKYSQIVTSASTLSFTFLADSNTKTVTIRVPFTHLNLTLSEPLVESPVPYFPCFTGGRGLFSLGRAFLQDAFLGANWGQSKWWLAQAPGPNIQLSPSVSTIAEQDTEVRAGNNDWKESWKGAWKVLTVDQANGTTPVEPPVQTATGTPSGGSGGESQATPGLSTGAKAGIGAGAAVLVLVVIGTVFFCRRRRRVYHQEGSVRHSEPPQYEDSDRRFQSQMVAEPYKGPAEVYGSFPIQTQEIPVRNEWARTDRTSNARVELP
ncbi:hypothetical protein CTA2_8202 [Colletotrichum tanaceti]|uniref:Peptidase A1 domain-containing protein n=1 Tax=Colletotrichum tanaceti TaxID=1306861 RepID=A0A4U6XKR0_9PEZI|nr:hypothetical protein CTA2_8202 [Colletotrichum tanaceti]TKW56107.1 hypothetical protein CTA1_8244 [Colletotrichum tanaceti]